MKYLILIMVFMPFIFYSCSKDNITERNDQTSIELRQTYSGGNPGFSFCDARTLTYCISDCFINNDDVLSQAMLGGINQAINEYNELEWFAFSEACDGTADILFECVIEPDSINNLACGYGNEAKKPNSSGQVIVLLNTFLEYYCCPDELPLTPCGAKMIAMHEIGHALGLGHTNNINAAHIIGTPDFEPGEQTSDPNSIMNSLSYFSIENPENTSGECNFPCEFSAGDLAAFGVIYDKPKLEFREKICSGIPFIVRLPNDLEGEWEDTEDHPAFQNPSNWALFKFETPGTYSITVTVNDCRFRESVTVEDCPPPGDEKTPISLSEIGM